MALSNFAGWNSAQNEATTAACGTACGAGDEPKNSSAACGTACGAGDEK